MYDAIIVGARCAGAATALLLTRKGHRVLLVDKAAFPSDTISGHFILNPGVKCLKAWGLLDKVLASNCPPITKWATNLGDFTLRAEIPLEEGIPSSIAPRRIILDQVLIDAAVEAGVEFRERFSVTELMTEKDQVIGIRGRTDKRQMVTEQGRIVIGADGKHSNIAQMVKAPIYQERPSLCCWYMTYWSGFPIEGNETHWRHHRMITTFPTNNGLVLTAVGWPHNEFHRFRSNLEANYLQTFELFPSLHEKIAYAKREDRFYGMADLPNFFRKPFGPGWALVGDAGHHKDPLGAYGISDAFRDAELLAEAVDKGLSGQQDLEAALSEYEQRRNARAMPDYEVNCRLAALEGWNTPDFIRLRAALQTNEVDRIRYFKVIAKALSPNEFYTPENIQRILNTSCQ